MVSLFAINFKNMSLGKAEKSRVNAVLEMVAPGQDNNARYFLNNLLRTLSNGGNPDIVATQVDLLKSSLGSESNFLALLEAAGVHDEVAEILGWRN